MILQTATTSFKAELAQGVHNFGPTAPDTFKLALYDATADINADTPAYTPIGEISGAGYTAGGQDLVISVSPTTADGVAYLSFQDAVWTSAAFTARGGLIYNASKGNASVAVLNFGADKTAVSSFTVRFPAATATAAIVRIS